MTTAIIFDCDGVIVDSEIISVQVAVAFFAERGLHYTQSEYCHRFMGHSDKAFFALVEADAQQRLGRSIIAEMSGEMMDRKRVAMEALKEVPGATAAITDLKGPKAVASSSTAKALERKLRHVGLFDHFGPHIYSADHVTQSKPAPDLFLHAAKSLEIPPSECLVLEDSVNGVLAARAAGMRVWGFLGGAHTDRVTGERLMAAGAERLLEHWDAFRSLIVKEIA